MLPKNHCAAGAGECGFPFNPHGPEIRREETGEGARLGVAGGGEDVSGGGSGAGDRVAGGGGGRGGGIYDVWQGLSICAGDGIGPGRDECGGRAVGGWNDESGPGAEEGEAGVGGAAGE